MTSDSEPQPRDVRWAPPPPKQRRQWSTWVWVTILITYLVALVGVTLVGVVLADVVNPILQHISRQVRWLTYQRLEFAANVVLFVPFGIIMSFLFRRTTYLVFPAAFVLTVAIEATQSLSLFNRVPSATDVIANTAGACVGILIAAPIVRRSRVAITELPNDQ